MTKQIHVGARVGTADRATLQTALLGPAGGRPEPGQMAWAGRETRVTGYRRGAGGRSLYLLDDAPGLWSEDWIDPL